MPDAATPEVKVDIRDAATFTQEALVRPVTTTTPEQAEKHRVWREKFNEGKDPKAILEEMRASTSEAKFGSNEAVDLQSKFGGGKTLEIAGPPPSTELDPKKSPTNAEKISFENAQRTITELNDFVQYTEILNEIKRSGKNINQIISERNTRGENSIIDIGSFRAARERALDALLANSNVQTLFPDIGSYNNINAKRAYIETLLAYDPGMRKRVAEGLKNAAERAQKLEEVQTDEELSKAETQIETDTQARELAIEDIINSLKVDAKNPPPTPSQEAQIRKMVEDGNPPEMISRYANSLVINEDNIPNLIVLNEIHDRQMEIAQRKEQLGHISAARDRTGILSEINQLNSELKDFITNNSISTIDINSFNDLKTKYGESIDAGGVFSGFVTRRAAEGSLLSRRVNENKNIIDRRGPEAKKKLDDSRNKRLRQEASIQDDLDRVLSMAVIDTVNERYDIVTAQEQKVLAEEAKKTENADDKAVVSGLEKSFIEFNPATRQKIVHQQDIDSAMKMLAYEGFDGIKRQMLRHMDFKTPQLDASGNPVLDASGNPVMINVDYRTVDLSTLPDDQKKRLDAMFAKYGDAYQNKIMKDAFAARTFTSKLVDKLPGTSVMGLRKHEWVMLEEKFSGKLTEALGKSQEASQMLKNLEAQGIMPDFKTKWLLAILLGLGIAAVGLPALGGVGAAASTIKGVF